MFDHVNWDISGVCNANCPYCTTGKKNLIGHSKEAVTSRKFISVEDFRETVEHLIVKEIITSGVTHINIYNWGEPFLHPKFEKILKILCEKDLTYRISTNASVIQTPEGELLQNCESVAFSMSGFSQASYDRIHGFKFEEIKKNIETIVSVWRGRGYTRDFVAKFHIYQFNIHEIADLKLFCETLNINHHIYYACPNDFRMLPRLLKKELEYDQMEKLRSELVTYFYDEILITPVEHCHVSETLTINEYCELLPCCSVDRDSPVYSLGDIRTMSLDEIIHKKENVPYCKLCKKEGIMNFGLQMYNWKASY